MKVQFIVPMPSESGKTFFYVIPRIPVPNDFEPLEIVPTVTNILTFTYDGALVGDIFIARGIFPQALSTETVEISWIAILTETGLAEISETGLKRIIGVHRTTDLTCRRILTLVPKNAQTRHYVDIIDGTVIPNTLTPQEMEKAEMDAKWFANATFSHTIQSPIELFPLAAVGRRIKLAGRPVAYKIGQFHVLPGAVITL